MLKISDDYYTIFQQVIDRENSPPSSDDPSQRMRVAGISFIDRCKIVAADGNPIQDEIVLECAKEFAAKVQSAAGDALACDAVQKDIIDLCDKIETRKSQRTAMPLGASSKEVESVAHTPSSNDILSSGPADLEVTSIHQATLPKPSQGSPQSLDHSQTATESTTTVPAVHSPIRKPATWQTNEPLVPWCPEAIQPHLGFNVDYKHNCQDESSASPGWHIVAATHRGRMHAHHGTHREDAFLFHIEKEFSIVCVSDGAGSYQHSRIGSESTCRRVLEELAKKINSQRIELTKLAPAEFNIQLQSMIGEAVQGACDFLRELAEKTGTEPRDFRCTLVLGILWLASETPQLFFSQVGDGFLATQKKDGETQRCGKSDSGAFSGEVNCFMPDTDAVHKAKEIIVIGATNVDAFIFCSDGIEDPFYPTEKKSQTIFRQLREGVSSPLSGFEKQKAHGPVIGSSDAKSLLADWLDFEMKGENDDRTIVILHRSPSQLGEVACIKSGVTANSEPANTSNAPSLVVNSNSLQ